MLIITVALAAAIVVVLLALIVIIIYQRWRIGDQNVFIERFIRQNEEQREKLKRAGIYKHPQMSLLTGLGHT